MPMYHPNVGEIGKEGQVLDLETAVKDGILGDVSVLGGSTTTTTTTTTTTMATEKLDLKKMIAELEKIEVPNVFICPISLEAMQDPVTLCTGQTYERSNIMKWLSLGHLTCPTTMQELWDDSITPNKTLQHLIFTWFSQKYLVMKKRSEDVQGRVLEILEGLKKKVKGQSRIGLLKELRLLVSANNNNNKTMIIDNAAVALITSLLGPFTSHAVGSEVVGILVNLSLEFEAKLNLTQPAKISLMVDMLNEGSIETKVNCTRLILGLMERRDFEPQLISSLSLLVGLLRLVKDKRNSSGVQPGLSLLKMISSHESLCCSIVSIGGIPQLVEILPSLNPECLELALGILDNLGGVQQGRIGLKDCPHTIPKLVKLLMRVSESCTQLALSILWAVCKLAPEECAPIAVEAGLAAKLLLVIQSGCNPTLKQQSAELLKLCSLNYTITTFISKCKLTRTLQ